MHVRNPGSGDRARLARVKAGAFIKSELVALWRSVVDSSYARRFVEAGEGAGFEVYTQAFEMLLRVSKAIDVTTQALFIVPSSQQTNAPAGGAAKATVAIQFARQLSDMSVPIVITPDVYVDEIAPDYSASGTVVVATGRRFFVSSPVVLGPGQAGPVNATCVAERSGFGANNAMPGSITQIKADGVGYSNDGASVVPGVSQHALITATTPDVPTPAQIGMYIELYQGANAGQVRRVVGFIPAVYEGSSPNGGQLLLAATAVWSLQSLNGTFQVGERATSSTGSAVVWFASSQWVVFDVLDGSFINGDILAGDVTGAQAELADLTQDPALLAETATAGWRVVGWDELGVVASNLLAPAGGRAAMLDLIGQERLVVRAAGESDDLYRLRVSTPADVVSPNAIRRVANRVLAPLGLEATLRETGLPTLRGIYCDGNPSSIDADIAFAYDLDFTARPEDRFKLAMDYLEFRAFFLIEVPNFQLGDFGLAYDAGAANAYDLSAPFNYGADGFAWETANRLRQLWAAVQNARGGGVGFDIVRAP